MMKVRKKTKSPKPFICNGLRGFLGITTVKFKNMAYVNPILEKNKING